MIIAGLMGGILLVLPACFGGDSTTTEQCCSGEAHHKVGLEHIKEVVPGVVLVNVLEKDHFENCRIRGSVSAPFGDINTFISQLEKEYSDKTAIEIIVYCSNYMCSASGETAKLLLKHGFTRVKAYEAGIAEWYQQGLPTEGACKLEGFMYLAKKMAAPREQDHGFVAITTQELAEKIGALEAQGELNIRDVKSASVVDTADIVK